jgi:crossover junction endodeoxyribonuclease RuvC
MRAGAHRSLASRVAHATPLASRGITGREAGATPPAPKSATPGGPAGVPLRVLGIDTSLRATGVALVEAVGTRMHTVMCGIIRNPPGRPISACLLNLQTELATLLTETRPAVAAIEGVFYCRNVRTVIRLGEARGAVIAACAQAACPVFEYEPRRVKQAVVGFGGATKEQIQHMVVSLLGLGQTPPEDAADALAIAICHLHNRNRIALGGAQAL